MCDCNRGYKCPICTQSDRKTTTTRKRRGITLRAAVSHLKGIQGRAYASSTQGLLAYRTVQGFLGKNRKHVGRSKYGVNNRVVFDYVNGATAPENVYNTPQEKLEVVDCKHALLTCNDLTANQKFLAREYINAAAVTPITIEDFRKRAGFDVTDLPGYWKSFLNRKLGPVNSR